VQRFAPQSRIFVPEFLHPVEDGPELRGYDLENARLRASDHVCLMDPEVRHAAESREIKTISFRPLRELMRGSENTRDRHYLSTDAHRKTVDSAHR
jgi:hypothetical protein